MREQLPSTSQSDDAQPTTTNPLLANATVRHTAHAQPDTMAAPTHVAVATPPTRRAKVPLEKGYSQVAWLHLSQRTPDLAGTGGRRGMVTMEEVKQHATAEDGWVVLRGKVYNITPYLKYHPGGARILAAMAGKDCTAQFNKFHAWVNGEALLAKCMVGVLAPSGEQA